jgi:hypothetical protein
MCRAVDIIDPWRYPHQSCIHTHRERERETDRQTHIIDPWTYPDIYIYMYVYIYMYMYIYILYII